MINTVVLGKGLGIVSPLYFVYDFLRKMLRMLYSLIDQISLPDGLYVLRY